MYENLINLFLEGDSGKRIIDSLPIAIYATDKEGGLAYFNTAAEKISGRKPQLGTDRWCVTWKLFHPDGTPMPHEECPMAVSLKEERSIEGAEVIAERPDGKRVWFRAYPSLLYNKNGELIGGINFLVDLTDQKETENQLRRSKKELFNFFENGAVGVHWVRSDGVIQHVNQTKLDMLGYSREEFIGSHIEDYYIDKDELQDVLQKLSEGEELINSEVRLKGKDGSVRHVIVNSNGQREEAGFIHTQCITRDITPRKQKQAELVNITARSEQQKRLYEAIISSTPDLVYVFDLNYRFIFANQSLLEMWGISREEAMGKSLPEIGYEPWHVEMHERELDQVVATKENVQGEVAFIHASLGLRYYDYIFVPVLDGEGKVEAVAGTTRDITERKKIEEALRKSEEKYRSLFETMDDGFSILQMEFDEEDNPTDWRYLETNPASNKHSGLGDREGKMASEVFPNLEKEWLETLGNVAQTGEPVQFENYAEELKRWFDISVFRVGKPEERKIAVLYKNITDSKQTRQELKAMNETLEERVKERTESLLSYQEQLRTLAFQLNRAEENQRQKLAAELHDNLGQVLALGKMKIDQLREDHFSGKEAKDFTELKELIDNALNYTRELMTDLKPPPSIDHDLKASISWVADKIKRHGLDVTIDDDELPKPLDEEIKRTVIQSVRELLINVVKHTSENEAVVMLRSSEDQLQITVKDDGEGFNAETKRLTPDSNGGFGIFNIQERIDLLGGQMDIDSAPGTGTKVTLYVPLAEERKIAGTLGSEKDIDQVRPEKGEDKIKVLLVDDHRMFREGIKKIIDDEKDIMVIGEAADGKEAVKLARETYPDIILMDVNMPVMDGIEATHKISSKMPDIKIVGLSLYDAEEIAEDMLDAGASAYLTKTEAFESLIVTIRAEASSKTG